jgi:hypothetical protein
MSEVRSTDSTGALKNPLVQKQFDKYTAGAERAAAEKTDSVEQMYLRNRLIRAAKGLPPRERSAAAYEAATAPAPKKRKRAAAPKKRKRAKKGSKNAE